MELNKDLIEHWERSQIPKPDKKRRRWIILGIILAVVLLAAFFIILLGTDLILKPIKDLTVKSNPGEWAMYGRDLQHSGVETLGNVMPEGKVTKIFSAGATLHSSPTLAGGIIYVGSRDGNLYAIQESSGQLLWSYKTSSWVDSSAVVVNNVVYFGSNDGTFNALNAKTGGKLWSYNVKYPVKSTAAVVDGKVYFGCDDYTVYCLNAANGKKIWSRTTGGSINSSPAISKGLLFVGSTDGNLYALDAKNGRQHLRFSTIKIVSCAPVVSDTTVYFITSEATLYAVNGQARNWFGEFMLRPPWQVLHVYGDLPAPPLPSGYLWSVYTKGNLTSSSPTLNNENIYFGMGSKVASFNITAKDKQWATEVNGAVAYAGVLSQNTVYATTAGGHLVLLDTTNGAILKDIAVGGTITSNPLMVDGKVYISSEDGNLYQVR